MSDNKKKTEAVLISEVNFKQKVDEYYIMNTQKKTLEAKIDSLKTGLKAYTHLKGTKNNDTGSFVIETPYLLIEERASKKVVLSLDKIGAYFLNRPEIVSKVLKLKPYIDEDELEALVGRGVLTSVDIENICDITTNYSFFVTPIEELPEAQKETFTTTAAQRRKPMLKPRVKVNE